MYLTFGLTVTTNEPYELGMWNFRWRSIIKIQVLHETVFNLLTVTNMAVMQNFGIL